MLDFAIQAVAAVSLCAVIWWIGDVVVAYRVYGDCDWRWGCLRRAREAYFDRRIEELKEESIDRMKRWDQDIARLERGRA